MRDEFMIPQPVLDVIKTAVDPNATRMQHDIAVQRLVVIRDAINTTLIKASERFYGNKK